MKRLALLSMLACLRDPAMAADQKVPVVFPGGKPAITLKGAVKGYDGVEYLLSSAAGGRWAITLQATGSTYFNITAPGADAALFIGSTSGNKFEGALPAAGEYRVTVYQMRNAARRGRVSNFSITFHLLPGHEAAAGAHGPAKFNAMGDTKCSTGSPNLDLQCGFKVVRKPGGNAEIWLEKPTAKSQTRVLLFSNGEFTTKDKAKVIIRKDNDTWYVTVDGKEVYMIPEAMILGG
jgi:hypothetical protein